MKLPSDECYWILLMINQHQFRKWLGAIRHQAITSSNVDPDLCRHMVASATGVKSLPAGASFTNTDYLRLGRG